MYDAKVGCCMQVHHGEVEAERPESLLHLLDPSLVAPDSMSWSNVVDYMTPAYFHRLATACSCESTAHYMHSMNWVLDVKGASNMHFARSMNTHLSAAQQEKRLMQLRDCYSLGADLFAKQLKEHKATHAVRDRMLDNVKNMADFYLQVKHHLHWVRAWEQEARHVGLKAVVEMMQSPECSALSRITSTIYLKCRYVHR
jgi:hypothetical protein